MKIKDIKDKSIRELAIKRCDSGRDENSRLENAFSWDDTPEGRDFWVDVNDWLTPEIPGRYTDRSEPYKPNTIKNGDRPINPTIQFEDGGTLLGYEGLTKREYACIKLGIPDTGDEEIDLIIKKSIKNKFAAMAMQGFLSNPEDITTDNLINASVDCADKLLKALES